MPARMPGAAPRTAAERAAPPAASSAALRPWLAALAAVYALFVVYGSLVPLQPVAMPLAEAWSRFLHTPWPAGAELSRTDLAVNIGLTVPLAFLVRAALGGHALAGAVALLASVSTWLLCALLSVGVEWAQVFSPDRSHAWSDVLAQWLGAAIGLALHRWRGRAFQAWALQWWQAQSGAPAAVWLLRIWLPVLALSSLVPLDLSISPVELYRKWRDGRIILLPLTDLPRGLAEATWELASDALLWAPVGAVWRLQGHRMGRVLWWGLLAAAAIELAQLLVLSRLTSSTDLVTACVGCALGALVAQGLAGQPRAEAHPMVPSVPAARPWRWAWSAWALLLLLLYWYPYAFDGDPARLGQRLREAVTRVPFEALYVSTEQRAVAELFRKVLLCLPLGLFWAVWRARLGPQAGLAALPAMMLAGGVALLVEAGQLALPDKVADLTDVALGVLGCGLGLLAGGRLMGRVGAAPVMRDQSARLASPAQVSKPGASRQDAARPGAHRRGLFLVLALIWGGLWVAWQWWPFDIQTDPRLWRQRWHDLAWAGGHASALAQSVGGFNAGLLQVLALLPLGLLLALWRGAAQVQGGLPWPGWRALTLLLALPLLALLGQLVLVSGSPRVSDAALAGLGGFAGLGLGWGMLRAQGRS